MKPGNLCENKVLNPAEYDCRKDEVCAKHLWRHAPGVFFVPAARPRTVCEKGPYHEQKFLYIRIGDRGASG